MSADFNRIWLLLWNLSPSSGSERNYRNATVAHIDLCHHGYIPLQETSHCWNVSLLVKRHVRIQPAVITSRCQELATTKLCCYVSCTWAKSGSVKKTSQRRYRCYRWPIVGSLCPRPNNEDSRDPTLLQDFIKLHLWLSLFEWKTRWQITHATSVCVSQVMDDKFFLKISFGLMDEEEFIPFTHKPSICLFGHWTCLIDVFTRAFFPSLFQNFQACLTVCLWANTAWHLEVDEKVDTATLLGSDWMVSSDAGARGDVPLCLSRHLFPPRLCSSAAV